MRHINHKPIQSVVQNFNVECPTITETGNYLSGPNVTAMEI